MARNQGPKEPQVKAASFELMVKDAETGSERPMTKASYDQVRMEQRKNGKPRYVVTKGTPNKLPQK